MTPNKLARKSKSAKRAVKKCNRKLRAALKAKTVTEITHWHGYSSFSQSRITRID